MVTYNDKADSIAPIEGLSNLITLLLQTGELTSDTVIASKGTPTLQERREFIALGKNPNTGNEMSLQEHHSRLLMMSASDEEWQGYHERVRKLRDL